MEGNRGLRARDKYCEGQGGGYEWDPPFSKSSRCITNKHNVWHLNLWQQIYFRRKGATANSGLVHFCVPIRKREKTLLVQKLIFVLHGTHHLMGTRTWVPGWTGVGATRYFRICPKSAFQITQPTYLNCGLIS